ncbi:MAG: histone deacetylase, partial [Marinoscillum sp.]
REEQQVFTLSMHGKNNYPLRKEISDLDIELEDDTGDATYLKCLTKNLYKVVEKFQPDFVFYQAGVDILKSDKLGRLGLTMEGCKKRDEIVVEFCKRNEIPLVVCMGGGYSSKLTHIIEAHANTFRVVQNTFF